MARTTQGFDPMYLGPQIEQVKEDKSRLEKLQGNYSLYAPIIVGVLTILGLYASRSKNKSFKKVYNEYYPLINGATMMVPAYFSWKTIQINKAQKEIEEKNKSVLG